MNRVTIDDIHHIHVNLSDSHKGQNGRLLLIGGSHLFHAASLWALTVASRIVDLVHYSSVPENNKIVAQAKAEFRNGIVVPRGDVEAYIQEDDCVLIGPGMVRNEQATSGKKMAASIQEITQLADDGEQTGRLTNYLLAKYPQKQWVLDAGALQMMDIQKIPPGAILTPHKGEFAMLWEKYCVLHIEYVEKHLSDKEKVRVFAKEYACIVLLKGSTDIACNADGECRMIEGGNAGMTKGGTGDVLAGLIAALACKNDPFLATIAGSFINKKAGDVLYKSVGPFFNATDLANQIPITMRELIIDRY